MRDCPGLPPTKGRVAHGKGWAKIGNKKTVVTVYHSKYFHERRGKAEGERLYICRPCWNKKHVKSASEPTDGEGGSDWGEPEEGSTAADAVEATVDGAQPAAQPIKRKVRALGLFQNILFFTQQYAAQPTKPPAALAAANMCIPG